MHLRGRFCAAASAAALFFVMTISTTSATNAQTTALDIENRRAVAVNPRPADAGPTCDVLVVGGGLGGVAAAEALARQRVSVILAEPTRVLGGQLTAQAVPVPDENRFIEQQPGPGTAAYHTLRETVRARYAQAPGLVPGREQNVGQCWVSRVSGEPAVWEAAIHDRLFPLRGATGIKSVLLRHQIVGVGRFPGNNRAAFADLVNLDTGRIVRVGFQYVLDATELGDVLPLAGSPHVVGQEAQSEWGEPHAPLDAHPEWIQSFTYCFALRWQPGGPQTIVEKPAEYDYFKSLGEYTLDYEYSERGTVTYKVFERAPGSGGPFWTYRRLVAASSFKNNPDYASDLALINWRGNDFHEENLLGKSVGDQVRILERGKAFAQGFLFWLQTECPRDDGLGAGYPEMQLAPDALGSTDGFALHPYVRESRRMRTQFVLNENHLIAGDTHRSVGDEFFDSVGCALYAIDIHPSKNEPPILSPAVPYHLPLGAFIPASGPPNVLPAAKNFGASRLALASARMHPTEWLAGEIAGNLAAFCLQQRVDPDTVRNTPALLAAFQARLEASGVATRWSQILPPQQ